MASSSKRGREPGLHSGFHQRPLFERKHMAKTSPFKFLQEVRAETQKVTWPTRRETLITTAMVFVMVALASVFFFLADQLIRFLVSLLLGLGS